ncbi:MAG TPA: hypothetical protein DEF51_26950 [Myxococcales bacterium]|nr:hypothetical protein [Myxococcales bacterium]
MHTVLPEWTALHIRRPAAVVDEMRRRMRDLSAELEASVAGLTHDREVTMQLVLAYAAALVALEFQV